MYVETVGKFEAEEGREKRIKEESKGSGFWQDVPIDDLWLGELEQYVTALEALKKKVETRG
ncbi:hypothetical protein RJ640_016763 [Escallonia rubra]|uniref:Uncharacterized protein n=1 Tax=Escallonia rubra TaxID=112253 RepID=A0AA88QSY5_9ASTE|nr:hypothetical protein RJ640_016763 [Escallonia rubra]